VTLKLIAHKFGGSSLGTAERISHVADLVLARDERQVIVVSAMQGVTDSLISLVQRAAARDEEWRSELDVLAQRHRETARLLIKGDAAPLLERFDIEFRSLSDLLHAQAVIGAVSPDILDLVSGLGEVWSSVILDAVMRHRGASSVLVDAREVLVVEKGELGAMVDWRRSSEKFEATLALNPSRLITTGFIARTRDGRITTLGRNGSDYSGAIFASLAGAAELHIWTDVDGVLSADPRLVPEAVLIENLSYSEACELAYFGAKVIHPQTMAPAIDKSIPIITRNTFNPSHPGTRVSADRNLDQPVKGVTTFSGLAIVNLEGAGMIGVPGTAERVFAALKQARVSVVMISQGSSEHSICCVIQENDADSARRALLEAFSREIASRQVQDVTICRSVAALAIVGDGMAGTPGVAARLFGALARAGVNIRVIAQGASERNISVVVDAADARRALRAVHSGFYLSAQTISIGVIGPGNVGGALLRQIEAASKRLRSQSNVDLRVRAIMSSSKMVLGEELKGLEQAKNLLAEHGSAADLARFVDHAKAEHLPHSVIIDCSGTDMMANHYADWLRRGIHVITPSKHAGSGSLERYQALRRVGNASFRYESTVGAGLPVISTLRDLLDTGDEVLSIDGILSGTLAYLFNRYDGHEPFSALVQSAKALGYTEPDPRDDLSGLDVARKLVILARECGWRTRIAEVHLESLVPEALSKVSTPAFLERLPELDGAIAARFETARAKGNVLRYVAHLDASGKATVGLTQLPAAHPFAHIRLTDNVIQFTTRRYSDNPLVVQGPGAGPEVTAAGIFADLLRVASLGGARL
jgi:aspartokinase/homoserine dehydrogenase 1